MSKYFLTGKKPLKMPISCIISKSSVTNLREDTNSMLPSKNCFCGSLKCGFQKNIKWRKESIGCLLCWPGRGLPVSGGGSTMDAGIPEGCLALVIRAGLLGRGTRVLHPLVPWSRTHCPGWWVTNPTNHKFSAVLVPTRLTPGCRWVFLTCWQSPAHPAGLGAALPSQKLSLFPLKFSPSPTAVRGQAHKGAVPWLLQTPPCVVCLMN